MLRPLAFVILVSSFALAGPASAAPNIASVSPRGLQIGQPTTLVITGSDLPADARILIAGKIAGQTLKSGAKGDRVEIEVTLDSATSPGLYPIRVAGSGGISNPIVVGVDRLPQVAFEAEPKTLPVALHGNVGAAQVLKMTLAGTKGQRLVLDLEAQRLGAGLKPVLRLYDPRGTQIAWSPPRACLGGDARVETVLPADAQYTVELHDQLYRPAGPGYFRLKIGDLQFADLALPLGATTGSKQAVRFASSNVADVVELDLTANPAPGETASPLPAADRFTGAAPRVAVTDFAELVEAAAAGGRLQELPQGPVAISGVLAAVYGAEKCDRNVRP